jgi:hypothetical protein
MARGGPNIQGETEVCTREDNAYLTIIQFKQWESSNMEAQTVTDMSKFSSK